MLKSIWRNLAYLEMKTALTEINLRTESCLLAELAPYQAIKVNSSKILFFQHGIKIEKSLTSLSELINTSTTKVLTVSFQTQHKSVSLPLTNPWRIHKNSLILLTSKAKIETETDFFRVFQGSALLSGAELMSLDNETIYVPKSSLAAAEEVLELVLGMVQGVECWKVTGSGMVLTSFGGLEYSQSVVNEEFKTESERNAEEVESILKNNDILVSNI